MKKIKNNSALLSKYKDMYEQKPKSRVFAPLAETYRKLGMIDEAITILNNGIKTHPSYTLGYIVLGHCYFDRQEFEHAYNTIRPFISQNLENITLQKLFAKTCINLGYLEEALQTFKYLLLLNPKDSYVADQIKLLEDDLMVEQYNDEIETKNTVSSFDEDEWVQVSFQQNTPVVKEEIQEEKKLEDWVVAKTANPLASFKEEISGNDIKIKEHTLDDDYFYEDYDNQAKEVITPESSSPHEADSTEDAPIITHTLVDLYIKQSHFNQAIALLESILELHPNDKATQDKLDEVVLLMAKEAAHLDTNDETHFIDENQINIDLEQENDPVFEGSDYIVKNNNPKLKVEKLEKVFDAYIQKLREMSQEKLVI